MGPVTAPGGVPCKGSGPAVYVMDGKVKRHFPSPDIYKLYFHNSSGNIDWSRVVSISDAVLNSFPTGSAVNAPEGVPFKGSGPAVYVMDREVKRLIPNPNIYKLYFAGADGTANWSRVISISEDVLKSIPTGTPMPSPGEVLHRDRRGFRRMRGERAIFLAVIYFLSSSAGGQLLPSGSRAVFENELRRDQHQDRIEPRGWRSIFHMFNQLRPRPERVTSYTQGVSLIARVVAGNYGHFPQNSLQGLLDNIRDTLHIRDNDMRRGRDQGSHPGQPTPLHGLQTHIPVFQMWVNVLRNINPNDLSSLLVPDFHDLLEWAMNRLQYWTSELNRLQGLPQPPVAHSLWPTVTTITGLAWTAVVVLGSMM